MNKGRLLNLVGIVLILIGAISILVGAVVWTGNDVDYQVSEDLIYRHNLSNNVTGFNSDITFDIDTIGFISWTDASGSRLVSEAVVSSWISIIGTELVIDAINDSQTGFFIIPIQASNATGDDTITDFEFSVNATNDIPIFDLLSDYVVSIPSVENTTLNITLIGSDEEEQYPLSYNISFDDCSFASWSDRTNTDCSLNYNIVNVSNIESILEFSDLSYNDVGVYNVTICVTDNLPGAILPSHYVSDYMENKTFCNTTKLNLLSSLDIDISDCDGRTWVEGDTLDCTINITTIGPSDSVDITSPGVFRNDAGAPHDTNWFYASQTLIAINNFISIPISIPLAKEEVGNWSITFSADDGDLFELPRPVTKTINFFVDYNEAVVSLSPISDLVGGSALYGNYNFPVTITDEDLRIWDDSVKKESFIISSNVSWVTTSLSNAGDAVSNTRVATISVDHNAALNNISFGVGNYTVQLLVTDSNSTPNWDFQEFVIEIRNDTAPEWNAGLSDPVVLELTEDVLFTYDLSLNVTDAELDPISFYFENLSEEFCSMVPANFNPTTGMISFVPIDCDVGYHDITIIASDTKLNSSHSFNFTVTNVLDSPSIVSLPSQVFAQESTLEQINFQVDDFDFLIPSGQSAFYDESLSVFVSIVNITNVVTPIIFNFTSLGFSAETELFRASFTPESDNAGDYNVTINVTDAGGLFVTDSFILNITQINDFPILSNITPQITTTKRIFYLDVNATDEEDSPTLPENGLLNYSLINLTVGGEFLTINLTTGIINQTMNESLAGFYEYNLSIMDTNGAESFQIFNLTVYGTPNITSPNVTQVFNWIENVSTGILDFEVDYVINETYLTYEIYIDRIVYSNITEFNYTALNESLRYSANFEWRDNINYTRNITPDYADETYGMEKNFTLTVLNTMFPELNSSRNWKVNITHTNEPISFNGLIPDKGPITAGSVVSINLNDYFSDNDFFDKKINQFVNFSITTNALEVTRYIESASTFNEWIVNLLSATPTIERITINAFEYDFGNNTIGSVSSNEFIVEFEPPTQIEVPKTKSSTKTIIKHFSLKLIMPQDIILSDENYIEIPFSIQNNGGTDLTGINLGSGVLFNNAYSDDIKVDLEDTYIPILKIGQFKNYTLKINADTQRSGKYKVTIFANVTSPKFSDWGDFFIELRKTNESDAEQILLFTEQLIIDNPECLELSEVFDRAREFYDNGDVESSLSLAGQVTVACEDAITANAQIRYEVKGFVERNFYIISLITLIIFFVGFIFYVYKRIRFNKSKENYYE